MRKTLGLFFVFVAAILALTTVSALELYASINNNDIESNVIGIERGESVPVKVVLTADEDQDNVKVTAWIGGYRRDIEDSTGRFDLINGSTYTKYLTLEIPEDIDEGEYTLYVRASNSEKLDEVEGILSVQRESYGLEVLSVDVSVPSTVVAGNALLVDVVVKNRGSHEAEDVYIKVSIPELGLERRKYVGDLAVVDEDEEEDTLEKTLALFVPADVASGSYTLKVRAYNSETEVTQTETVNVAAGRVAAVTQVMPQQTSQDVSGGSSAVYDIAIANLGNEAQTYSLSVEGTAGWATAQIPSQVSLGAGETQTVHLYLAVNEDAVPGTHIFTVKISDGAERQVNLTANVAETAQVNILLVSVIVLAVIFIILIILLLATKKPATEAKSEESYY